MFKEFNSILSAHLFVTTRSQYERCEERAANLDVIGFFALHLISGLSLTGVVQVWSRGELRRRFNNVHLDALILFKYILCRNEIDMVRLKTGKKLFCMVLTHGQNISGASTISYAILKHRRSSNL